MSPRDMAVSNTRYLSSSETRVNAGIRGSKLHLCVSTWCQESVGGICFTNKWRVASLQPLTFSNHCLNAVCSNASPGLTVRFILGENWGFLKAGAQTYRMAAMSPLNLTTIFFVCASIFYGLDGTRVTPILSQPKLGPNRRRTGRFFFFCLFQREISSLYLYITIPQNFSASYRALPFWACWIQTGVECRKKVCHTLGPGRQQFGSGISVLISIILPFLLSVTLNYQASGYNTGYKVVTLRVHHTTHAGCPANHSPVHRLHCRVQLGYNQPCICER
jgi:hypothetical protein